MTEGEGSPPESGNAENPEDIRLREEEEKVQLEGFIAEVNTRLAWKKELRVKNENAEENRPEEGHFHKLDSSLKKNTAFVRKLKSYTDAQKEVIKKDIKGLNLTKYIGEVASALVEAKLKMSDLTSALDICSILHQTYAEFSSQMLEVWQKVLSLKKDEKVANPSKFRVDLRFFSELLAVKVFPMKQGLSLLGQVLTMLIANDREEFNSVNLILTFCKHCGDDFAGLVPRKMARLADKLSYQIPQSDLMPPEKQKNVRQLLKDYYLAACKHLISVYKSLQQTEKTNRKILLTKGELHQERKDAAEALQNSYSKLYSNCENLSDILDEEMPEMPKEEEKKDDLLDNGEMDDAEVEESALGSLWEDDETKAFYEHLSDLKSIIPAILYKDSQAANVETPEAKPEEAVADDEDLPEEAIEQELETMENEPDMEEVAPPAIDDETEEPETVNSSAKMQFDAFLGKLTSCVSREMIDSAAVEFCMSHNTKNNRKKLVKNLFSVHRNRSDLLPFFARLSATLQPCMPEVPSSLAQYLKQEFRWQVRKKDQMKIESKLKVCRFLGEMVKFGLFPKSEILFCVRQLLFDFSHHHIEMACTIMEACGRFLYRSTDSHRRAKIYLEQMMRRKTAMAMDSRYAMMIENAFYNVNPPESPLAEKVVIPPLHEYIDKLLYLDLNRTSTEKVLKQIRKIDWAGDKEAAEYAVKCLGSVWNVKYFNIQYAASLLAGLVSYHDWVGPRIVDGVLEDIRLHLEVVDPKFNQRRISVAKFLAELYNYRLIDSAVIFKVLYLLISFGVVPPEEQFEMLQMGIPMLDPPDHLLRIRLICVILDTCGVYFSSGASKKKLDYFLVYFQRYYWRKVACGPWNQMNPFPIAITNLMQETIPTLRPKLELFKSLEECEAATDKIEKEMLAAIEEKAPEFKKYILKPNAASDQGSGLGMITEGDEDEVAEDDFKEKVAAFNEANSQENESESELDSEDDYDEDSAQRTSLKNATCSQEDEEDEFDENSDENSADDNSSDSEDEDDDEDDDLEDDDESLDDEDDAHDSEDEEGESQSQEVVGPKHVDCEEDEEFVSMFDKMLNENISSESRSGRGHQIDIVAPVSMRHKRAQEPIPEDTSSSNTMQFTVLVRKNNKPAYKEVAVPKNSEMARNLEKQEEADRLEKERVKKLTLQINERQEEEDMNEAIAAMQRPGLVSTQARGNYHRRHTKGNHPKGAPDADLIFGSKRIPRP